MSARVYFFKSGYADGNSTMTDLLGGKGANLAEMARLGLPVPPGFTIPTSECTVFVQQKFTISDALTSSVETAMIELGRLMGGQFGNPDRPLLVSVRSGARASMPGMMDTILNLGLNDEVCTGLAKLTGNPRFAFDTYRRFIEMYGSVVDGIDRHLFEDALTVFKTSGNGNNQNAVVRADTDLTAEEMQEVVSVFKQIYLKDTGKEFPQDPFTQLWSAIRAVFLSWNSSRARKYRSIHHIPDDWGTAVNICTMVYGNMGANSGTGVCFTRNPSTGENIFFGEYLINAQGEDVVAGIRTPKQLAELATELPEAYAQLVDVRHKLELHYGDVQDIEFTIQEGKLFLLQTRRAKRTTAAALRIAAAFVEEGMLSKSDALLRVNAGEIERLLHPTLDPRAHRQVIAKGLPASPGAVAGRIVFSATDAEVWAVKGEQVILVREETSPEDIGGMHVSRGFLTARGGMTSHAAVVARQMGKSCVAGCGVLRISEAKKTIEIGTLRLKEGDWITLDGATGEVMLGQVATQDASMGDDLKKLIQWSIEVQTMHVRANADTPNDARMARSFGAQGIGLCRTEHMFFDEKRLPLVRHMILSKSPDERNKALDELLPHQESDFEQLLQTMSGFPVTIRLLDPPLHEFLPHPQEDLSELAEQIGISSAEVAERIHQMSEQNPMLGHRGCRLGISQPAIYEMQVRAICRATLNALRSGHDPKPEIMIPLVGLAKELDWLRTRLEAICQEILTEGGFGHFEIPFGTMIEVPRAALTADAIAQHADFFSFGTNDLTQTTYGFSRDDSASFMRAYEREGIMPLDPFSRIDEAGVGKLLEMTVTLGRKTKPALKIGICGEQAGYPDSIKYLQGIGLNYVSCSPFRVPIAQIASAQAALLSRKTK
jgi:pyruvate,orthophosphate dikinase